MKTGYPNSEKIKSGLKSLKFHLDYLNWLLEKGNGLLVIYLQFLILQLLLTYHPWII